MAGHWGKGAQGLRGGRDEGFRMKGTPHHRLLASPAGYPRLTGRMLASRCSGGGGGGGGGAASPQAFGRVPRGELAGAGELPETHVHAPRVGLLPTGGSPSRRWCRGCCGGGGGPGREGGCWPRERHLSRRLARAPARPGGRGGRSTGLLRLFSGAMSVHGPGRTVEGTDSRPRWFLSALCAFAGGGGCGAVSEERGGRSLEGEQPSVGKTQRASTLGNHRSGCGEGVEGVWRGCGGGVEGVLRGC